MVDADGSPVPDVPAIVRDMADVIGATIIDSAHLPDGTGFAVMSMPLPADHWSTVNPDAFGVPPMGLRCGTDHPQRQQLEDVIRAAVQYAYRAVTANGTDMDLDPDALVQNAIIGLLGYYTPVGLSADDWANPSPLPSHIEYVFHRTDRDKPR